MSKPYFYIIEHKRSKMKYAGSKWSKNADPERFMKTGGYLTSSSKIKEIINAEGLDSFNIICIKSETECGMDVYSFETRWLRDHNCAQSKEWFNKHNNNKSFGKPEITDSLRSKRSYNRKEWLKDPVNLKLASDNMKKGTYKNSERFSGEGNPFYGRRHSEESKNLMSEKLKGREIWNTGKTKETCGHSLKSSERMKANNPMKNMSPKRKKEIYSNRVQRSTKGMKKFFNKETGEYRMFRPGEELPGFAASSQKKK